MNRSIGTGWAVGIVTICVLCIGGAFWCATRTRPTHPNWMQTMGKAKPPQKFIPKATDP